MRLTIDTTEARSFELAEPGAYEMKIHSISDLQKGEKAPYVTVEYEFQDPKMDQTCGRVQRNYPVAGKGAGFFREFWKAATGEDIPIGTQLDINPDDAIGRPVVVEIAHREYEGRTYNEPKTVVSGS